MCAVELPLQLTRGHIGRLTLRVPWSRLRSEPVEIIFDDVLLEATLRDTPDADAFERTPPTISHPGAGFAYGRHALNPRTHASPRMLGTPPPHTRRAAFRPSLLGHLPSPIHIIYFFTII